MSSNLTPAAFSGGNLAFPRPSPDGGPTYDSQYRRYGYRCTRYDARVGRYRLTRA